MSNPNPYQSPSLESAAILEGGSFRVDGKLLVVMSGAVLPPMCVKTNQPVTPHDMTSRQLTWCSPLVGALILLSGLVLILVYFAARKRCVLTFGLLPKIKRRYRNLRILKAVAAISLLFALPIAAGTDSTPVIVVVFVLFLIAVVSLLVGNSPLAVTKFQNGEFWIAGCSRDFIASVQSRAAS